MSDDSDDRRDALHAFLQEQGPPPRDEAEPHIDERSLLTGWVIVVEWMDPDGERWLSRGYSATKAQWDANGMLHEALNGTW